MNLGKSRTRYERITCKTKTEAREAGKKRRINMKKQVKSYLPKVIGVSLIIWTTGP